MFLRNGLKIDVTRPITVDDTTYYANTDPVVMEMLGITEVPDPVRPDDRYYWVTENPDGSLDAREKDLATLKSAAVDQVNATARVLLAPTDFHFPRTIEDPTYKVYPATLQQRAAIRAAAADAVTAINAATDVPSLVAASPKWPQQ